MTEKGAFDFFGRYNNAIWPMQVVVYVLALVAVYLAFKKYKSSDRIIAAVLAIFWLWNGIMFFFPIGGSNVMWYVGAALFSIQGILFLIGAAKPNVSYRIGTDIYSLTGIVLILYGLIGSPLVGALVGHLYPRMALVGLFPCPLITFTFGLLLCTDKVPKYLLVVPFLWGLLSALPPYFGNWEDVVMVVGSFLATAMLIYRERKVMVGTAPHPA